MKKIISPKITDFEYFIKGTSPRLLIHSGTHGDEFEVIDVVKKCIEKYQDILPDFLFVPYVSPSAVKIKSRFNGKGMDMNRVFFSDSNEEEVLENMEILSGHSFDIFVSFHEDPELEEYYIYDEGLDEEETEIIKKHNNFLKTQGIKLLNGVDDPNDPALGYEFKDGYRKFTQLPGTMRGGTATVWVMSEKNAQICLTPEIPGKLSMSQKEFIVESFFLEVLCRLDQMDPLGTIADYSPKYINS